MNRRRSDWRRGKPSVSRGGLEISVVICTLDRAVALTRALEALNQAALQCPGVGFQFVIVDNGSVDDTPGLLSRLKETSRFPVVTLHEPRRGLAVARNAALKWATGDLLVFVDDDCELRSDYFRRLCDHYKTDHEPVIRGGRVELADERDQPVRLKLSPRIERLDRDTRPGGFIHGCNMTIPRDVVGRVGPFDERFGLGGRFRAAEDTDYLVRAFIQGVPIEYVPDMVVRHRHGQRTRRAARSTVETSAFGHGAIYVKHLRKAPFLMRHVRGEFASGLRETMGGPPFDRDVPISHWRVLIANLHGIVSFMRSRMMGRSSQAHDPGGGLSSPVGDSSLMRRPTRMRGDGKGLSRRAPPPPWGEDTAAKESRI